MMAFFKVAPASRRNTASALPVLCGIRHEDNGGMWRGRVESYLEMDEVGDD